MEPCLNWPGKSPVTPGGPAHPAAYHMLDVAAVAELIAPPELAPARREALILLTALHDLGKIGAGFRAMLETGATQPHGRHWEMTEVLLHHHEPLLSAALGGSRFVRWPLFAAVAGHHGRPPQMQNLQSPRILATIGAEALADSAGLIRGLLALWPAASLEGMTSAEAKALSWWLPGFIATADWVGSNPGWLQPCAAGPTLRDYLALARRQARRAVDAAGLLPPPPAQAPLFDFALRPMQAACAGIVLPDGPSLVVIEDETGTGKTEAALILAQRMMLAGKGRGLYIALPTTATADAMFPRARDAVRTMFAGPPTLTLAHGRAMMNRQYREMQAPRAAPTDEPVCTEWLADDRRRVLLGTVGVGTIDQALLAVLPTRFNTLRQYGLSAKILIVDEVHEMGAPYLAAELAQLLRAHRAQGGSAILLTATLPLAQRRALLAAWGEEGAPAGDSAIAYPALTVAGQPTQGGFPQKIGPRGIVEVRRLPAPDNAVALLAAAAVKGAACLWVRNAVDDAIAAVDALRAAGVDAMLLHARFALADRLRHEGAALARFGKDGTGRAGQVLVATQVVESSLDLDFDVMVSDLAPVAALVQRAGRLWRHMDRRPAPTRPVPAPLLHVIAPDPDLVEDDQWLHRVLDKGAWVYPIDLQWRTARALFDAGAIVAPTGLRALIEAVHGHGPPVPAPLAAAEIEREGRGYAESSQARRNVIVLEKGYRDGGASAPDTLYPTRLGCPTRALLLAVWEGAALRPYAGAGSESWQMSEVQVAAHRLAGLDLPDQTAPAIPALTAGWLDWQRETVTVCPMGPDGEICAGLRYDPSRGMLFPSGEDPAILP